MKIGIVNYGMGNLGSVRRALEDLKANVFIAEHPYALFDANRIVLPGVGAFSEAMRRLQDEGWNEALNRLVKEQGRPLLGICLGMQLLASRGTEGGDNAGLGMIDGVVEHLSSRGCKLRIPHVGWNEIRFRAEEPLFAHIPQCADFYFVHSYVFVPADEQCCIAKTDYGTEVVAAVRNNHVFGTQFHPEKSSRAGRQILRNFLDYRQC
jgi:imidazole glycerol-phosphate synthase subunit HisH